MSWLWLEGQQQGMSDILVGAAQGVLLPWPTCSLKENPRPWGGQAEGDAEEWCLREAQPVVSSQGA